VGRPAPEIDLTPALVRRLICDQHPDRGALELAPGGTGWDNVTFRLGEHLAVRLPHRAAAARLIEHEQRWLPVLERQLPLAVPSPVRIGRPQHSFPWAWSIVPWIKGRTADRSSPAADQAEVLAAFLDALHTAPAGDAPRNPYRGMPLIERQAVFERCTQALGGRGRPLARPLASSWESAVSAPPALSPSWIHGDLHAHNVLVHRGRLSGVIDWGDLAQGDPATDLAAVWMVLPQRRVRERALRACRCPDAHAWVRARGWALLIALLILEAQDASLAPTAEATLRALSEGP